MWSIELKYLIEMNALELWIVLGLGLAVTIKGQFADKCEFPVELVNNHDIVVLLNRAEMNFSCQKSYYRGSIPLKHCQSQQGSWMYCLAGFDHWTKCGYPGYPSNGYIYIDSKKQLSYACDYGFDLLGEVERRCSNNGAWVPIIPKCVKNLAKDIGYPELIDKDLSTFVNLKQSAYTQFEFKKEIYFDILKIRFKNWNADNVLYIYYSQYINDNSNVIIKRDPLPNSFNFQEIESTTPSELKLARYLIIWPVKPISIYEISIYNSHEQTACDRPNKPLHGRIKTINSNVVEFECDWNYKLHGQKSAFCIKGVWQFPLPVCNYSPTTPSTITTTTQAPRQSTTTRRWTKANPTTRATTRTPATTVNMNSEVAYTFRQDKNDEKNVYNTDVNKDIESTSIKNNDDTDANVINGNLSQEKSEENDEYNTNIGIGVGVVAACIILITTMCFIKWFRADRRRKNASEKTNSNLINSESQQHSECAQVENASNPYENLNSKKYSDLLASDENSASNVYADCSLPISSNDDDDGNYAVPILPDENNDTINVENDYYVSY